MTNYSSYESFLRTATGSEKDALHAFQNMDHYCGQDLIDREDDLYAGCRINAAINKGWAGMTEEELIAEGDAEIAKALEEARQPVEE